MKITQFLAAAYAGRGKPDIQLLYRYCYNIQ